MMDKINRDDKPHRWGGWLALLLAVCLIVAGGASRASQLLAGADRLAGNDVDDRGETAVSPPHNSNSTSWALEETFDGDPDSPSQALLPRNFSYVVTHRTVPGEQFSKDYRPFPADHDDDCNGPNPDVSPLPQHMVQTIQGSNSTTNIDESFFICKNHMMTAMGDVDPYSVSAFWPRQEFDFSDGGTLEFEVNINLGHKVRSWWEIMIVPRDQLRLGSGPIDSPIDETYPTDRIVFEFRRLVRGIKVGTGVQAPDGWLVNEQEFGEYDFSYWNAKFPDDPALTDRRIRRTMRIRLEGEQVIWSIEKEDGTFHDYAVEVPGGLPFDRGLVLFKTHAYTPDKDENFDTFTFHWDNIRFDGPVVGQYDAYDASSYVYLQRNGDRPLGDSETVTVNLPRVGNNPVLIGQIHQPKEGQVLLSINGRSPIAVHPFEYNVNNCLSDNWKSFRLELDPSWLNEGENRLTWTVGPRPENCYAHETHWDGFSVKALQIHMDGNGGTPAPPPNLTETVHLPFIER